MKLLIIFVVGLGHKPRPVYTSFVLFLVTPFPTILFWLLVHANEMPDFISCFWTFTSLGQLEHKSSFLYILSSLKSKFEILQFDISTSNGWCHLSMNHLDTKYELIDYKHRINTKYCVKISWIEKINPWSQGKWSKSTLGHWWTIQFGSFRALDQTDLICSLGCELDQVG